MLNRGSDVETFTLKDFICVVLRSLVCANWSIYLCILCLVTKLPKLLIEEKSFLQSIQYLSVNVSHKPVTTLFYSITLVLF